MTTAISAQVVKELREQTGAGMMDCKRALAECAGDMEQAKDWLRKRGQKIADKKAARKASEGLIFSRVSEDGRTATMLELNCETDFVARNEAFPKLGQELLGQLEKGAPGASTGNVEEYLASPSPRDSSQPVSELIREQIATLGENLGVGRIIRMEAADGNSVFQTYIHPPGKLGVLIEVRMQNEATKGRAEFQEFCRDLAMHVAAADPQFLDRSLVTEEKLEREKEIYREQARNEGKAENLIEKIAQGKLGSYYQQVCLVEQAFVKDPSETIQKLTDRIGKAVNDKLAIARFARVKVGG